jgi:hypothetical protein
MGATWCCGCDVHGRRSPAPRRAREGALARDHRGELPRRSGAGLVGGRRGRSAQGWWFVGAKWSGNSGSLGGFRMN